MESYLADRVFWIVNELYMESCRRAKAMPEGGRTRDLARNAGPDLAEPILSLQESTNRTTLKRASNAFTFERLKWTHI
jgi:hypothetical protein